MAEGGAAAAERRRLAAVVESWLGRPVLVIGDAMLDDWRFADSDRLCREAPAPVLTLRRRIAAAGGAANTAVNLAALGGRPALVAPIGADVAGDELHDCLDRAGVWDRTVSQHGRPTPIKRRMLAADQILLREDSGEPDDGLGAEAVARLLTALDCATEELRALGGGHAPTLVVCDYGLGALPEAVRAWVVRHRERFATVALDAHDLAQWRGLAPTVVTPSFAEATRLLARTAGPNAGLHLDSAIGPAAEPTELTIGMAPGPSAADRARLAEAHLAELRRRTGADVVAVTLDTEGAIVGGPEGEPRRSHSTPVPASHAVGAGDAYLAAMTLALAAEAPLSVAAQLAQLAATITISDTGTCVCRRDALLAALGAAPATTGRPVPYGEDDNWNGAGRTVDRANTGDGLVGADGPVSGAASPAEIAALVDAEQLTTAVTRARLAGRTVVFTNGCFDVLHRGHVRYLEQAARLGGLLVVAVNSDDGVRRLKGPDRPVNPVEDRVAVLAALGCVDLVVVFAEDSPAALIEAIQPDVYVKGGDYPPELVPEAPLVRRLGGEVHTLGYVPDRSTSAIIDRIRAHDPLPTVEPTGPEPPVGTTGPEPPVGTTGPGPMVVERPS